MPRLDVPLPTAKVLSYRSLGLGQSGSQSSVGNGDVLLILVNCSVFDRDSDCPFAASLEVAAGIHPFRLAVNIGEFDLVNRIIVTRNAGCDLYVDTESR